MRTIDKRVRRLEDLELCRREQNAPTETGEAKRLYLERLRVIGERLQGAKDRGEWVAPEDHRRTSQGNVASAARSRGA